MKKICFFTITLFILMTSLIYAQSPKFEIKEPEVIYEDLIEGKKLVHTFKFKNSGNEKLEIKNLKARG
ncbi:MAG: hypothetical protein RBR53_10015 [Desulforegulaceae bacterium]|nr:hypothetical protein [Desulforegulaceae bacterium]